MKIHTDFLPATTRRLLLELAGDKEIKDFVLVGGTACRRIWILYMIATLAQRNALRDYYDLYILAKNHMGLDNIFQKRLAITSSGRFKT